MSTLNLGLVKQLSLTSELWYNDGMFELHFCYPSDNSNARFKTVSRDGRSNGLDIEMKAGQTFTLFNGYLLTINQLYTLKLGTMAIAKEVWDVLDEAAKYLPITVTRAQLEPNSVDFPHLFRKESQLLIEEIKDFPMSSTWGIDARIHIERLVVTGTDWNVVGFNPDELKDLLKAARDFPDKSEIHVNHKRLIMQSADLVIAFLKNNGN